MRNPKVIEPIGRRRSAAQIWLSRDVPLVPERLGPSHAEKESKKGGSRGHLQAEIKN